MKTSILAVSLALAGALSAAPAGAQDTLRLGELGDFAVERDPRARQLALQAAATELRLRNLAMERLPSFTLRGEAIHQSEVPAIPIELPNIDVPEPPADRYEAAVALEQSIYDGGSRDRRRAAEEAELRVERARIAAALYPLRSEVSAAYFRALLVQSRAAEVTLLIEDLEARLELLRARVAVGAALPSDTAQLRAEMLGAMQSRAEATADRIAALATLEEITGRPIGGADVLELPDLAATVDRAIAEAAAGGRAGDHPRYALFEAQRAGLERRSELVAASLRPRVVGFGSLAYGRPGYQQFTDDFHEYWTAGVRLQWQPWNWGNTRREREVIELEREIVDTEQAAFTDELRRQVVDEEATIERLEAALETDDQIIALREQVEATARVQLEERAITVAGYVDARTDLQEARLARQRHRIELAHARARYLTILGVDFR